MAHFFVPSGEPSSAYGTTSDGGYLHAWKLTVNLQATGKIGLWGGYDRGVPLKVSSNNPGIIDVQERPMSLSSGDRIITVTGRKVGFTILDAGLGAKPWCSLQVEVRPAPVSVKVQEWQLYRMAAEYYKRVMSSEISNSEFCRKWKITQDQFNNLPAAFRERGYGREYWERMENGSSAPLTVHTRDFLVIGLGGVVTKNSDYGDVVLGMRIQSIQAHSGIGSVAGAVARIFTSDPDIIGVIEASGDLIEVGASGFAIVRANQHALKTKKLPTATIQQRKIVGDLFRDRVFDHLTRMHQGTEYTVEKEIAFETDLGLRKADVILRDGSGKIVGAFECKTGKGEYIKEQFKKDSELYFEKHIRTIKVTEDFFFVPE